MILLQQLAIDKTINNTVGTRLRAPCAAHPHAAEEVAARWRKLSRSDFN